METPTHLNAPNQYPQPQPLRKTNDRWKWMAGATAVAAAAVPHAHAQTAQISLINNQLDSIGGDTLSLAVTAGSPFGVELGRSAFLTNSQSAIAHVNIHQSIGSVELELLAEHWSVNGHRAALGTARQSVSHVGAGQQTAFALIPVSLQDPNINGDALTNGLLEAEAVNVSPSDQTVALLSVFYPETGNSTPSLSIDSTSGAITGAYTNVGSSNAGVYTAAVPEPSGLALLALGAGALATWRARRKAA